jgi:hypothetical protein
MTITRNTLEKRVKLGAHLLDLKVKGWHADIDLPKLNMANGFSCILGQEYGDYWDGAKVLKLVSDPPLSEKKVIAHGFTLADSEDTKSTWSALAELWAIEVAKRLVRK